MIERITHMGRRGCDLLEAVGRASIFLGQSMLGRPSAEGFSLWVAQVYAVGVLSLAIVLVSGLFFVIANLVIDIVLGLLDPRHRLRAEAGR